MTVPYSGRQLLQRPPRPSWKRTVSEDVGQFRWQQDRWAWLVLETYTHRGCCRLDQRFTVLEGSLASRVEMVGRC